MDAETLYTTLTRDSGIAAIQAGAVERYVDSPITFWCDIHAPPDGQDSINLFQQHLFDTGHQHQTEVTGAQFHGAVQEIFHTEEDGFRRTLKLMLAGETYLKDMPLLCRPMGVEGRPDILARVDGLSSDLGSFSYQVFEIKSAKNIRESHILQGALYNRLLGQVQGYEPEEYGLINRDHELTTIRMAEVADRLDQVLSEIRGVLAGADVDLCHGAARWPWESFVNKKAIERNDVSLIPGVGVATRRNLCSSGYTTVADIAATDEKALTQVDRVGVAIAKKFISSAESIGLGLPVRRAPTPAIRRGVTDVFLDFEGTDPRVNADGLEVVNYLIGALVRHPSHGPTYIPFFAPTFDAERAMLVEFFDWVPTLDDPVIYHWHHYERIHLTKMAEHYEIDPAKASYVIDRLVDLYPVTNKSFAFPTYGEGLKNIARSLGFAWRQADVTGLNSIALYLTYVESSGSQDECREKIFVYNEDDCLATMHVFDWLLSQEE